MTASKAESSETQAEGVDLDAADVVSYLRAHPDFFADNKFLLAELNLPHASGRAVSLVERQVDILRERNMVMRKRMNELLHTARHNDELFSKTRSLTLAFLECDSMQALNEVLATHVLVDFEADFVACHLSGAEAPNLIAQGALDHFRTQAEPPTFSQLINGDQATCISLRNEELNSVFPMADIEAEGSAVLIPFSGQGLSGILAIGSRDAGYFTQDMDTLFVRYIADVLNKVLQTQF